MLRNEGKSITQLRDEWDRITIEESALERRNVDIATQIDSLLRRSANFEIDTDDAAKQIHVLRDEHRANQQTIATSRRGADNLKLIINACVAYVEDAQQIVYEKRMQLRDDHMFDRNIKKAQTALDYALQLKEEAQKDVNKHEKKIKELKGT